MNIMPRKLEKSPRSIRRLWYFSITKAREIMPRTGRTLKRLCVQQAIIEPVESPPEAVTVAVHAPEFCPEFFPKRIAKRYTCKPKEIEMANNQYHI